VIGRWSGLTSASGQFTWAQRKGAFGRAPRGAECGEELIGRAARPITCDRTRPVAVGALWTPTGRRVQRVRSLRGARPVGASRAQALCDRRVRLIGRRIRSIAFDRWCAVAVGGSSGRGCFQEDTWTAQGNRTRCSASGQFDQRVRSLRVVPNEGVQRLFCGRAYK
jgi:hypothetical protein